MMTDDVYKALCCDDPDKLRQLMAVGTGAYNIQLWDGTKIWPRITRRMTAVQLAVREGSGKVLEMLIDEAKLDVNFGQASTALTTAVEYKRYDMMVILLSKGVQVNKAIMHGYSGMGEGWVLYSYPIHLALSQDNVSYLRLLLQHGADPLKEYSDFSSINKYETTIALSEAARRKKYLHLAFMLQTVATLSKSAFGMNETLFKHIKMTYMYLAQQENSGVLIELLIELAGSSLTKDTSQVTMNPLKLKQICRRNLRKSYRSFLKDEDKNNISLTKTICKLPLPRLLVNYLLFEEEIRIIESQ